MILACVLDFVFKNFQLKGVYMKEFFKTLGKGLLALALVGGLATGGYYLGTAIVPEQKIEQPDKPDSDLPNEKDDSDKPINDPESEVKLLNLDSLGLTMDDFVYLNEVEDGYWSLVL